MFKSIRIRKNIMLLRQYEKHLLWFLNRAHDYRSLAKADKIVDRMCNVGKRIMKLADIDPSDFEDTEGGAIIYNAIDAYLSKEHELNVIEEALLAADEEAWSFIESLEKEEREWA